MTNENERVTSGHPTRRLSRGWSRSLSFTAVGLLAAACAPLGCSSSPKPGPLGDPGVPSDWYVEYADEDARAAGQMPDAVVLPDDMPSLLPPGGDAAAVALDFLAAHPEVFGMKNPRDVLDLDRVEADDANQTRALRASRRQNRVPVFGEGSSSTSTRTAPPSSWTAPSCRTSIPIADQTPKVDPAVAAKTAFDAALEPDLPPPDQRRPRPALRLGAGSEDEAAPALAFMVTVGTKEVFVDAMTGEVLHTYSIEAALEASGQGASGSTVKFPVIPSGDGDGSYWMWREGTSDRQGITAGNITKQFSNGRWEAYVEASTSLASGWNSAAVDAYVHLLKIDQWYREKVGRKAYSLKDKEPHVWAVVGDKRSGGNNAFGGGSSISFGNGIMSPSEDSRYPPTRPWSSGLDMVAHEYAHCVTWANSRRGYLYERQPGAINEALSDVFGALIERDVQGEGPANFLIGEDITVNRTPVRDMRYPNHETQRVAGTSNLSVENDAVHLSEYEAVKKPNASNDYGGVHKFATIGDLAFVLMVRGGAHPVNGITVEGSGLGWNDARRVWWNTQRNGLRPKSRYRNYAMSQALFGKRESAIRTAPIACAWRSVGALNPAFLRRVKVTCKNDGAKESGDVCKGRWTASTARLPSPPPMCAREALRTRSSSAPSGRSASAPTDRGAIVCRDRQAP